MMSATHYFGDIDVICDIGGQDIKVLFMQNGDIKNFRLSNQCSAGNGMLLQAMADQFGVKVTDYADVAFEAKLSPKFSYGCAVFLDSDRVNFQKEGFSKEELLAGLAQVLPKNVWQYVVQIPRMAELGKKFVLQGGTQHNLAALKAQVDYIKERVPGAEVYVHPHTGEAGAIGAAMETRRVVMRRGYSTFIGIDAAINLEFTGGQRRVDALPLLPQQLRAHVHRHRDARRAAPSRYISGFSCEKGTVESEEAMIALTKERKKLMKEFPNLVDYESKQVFRHFYDPEPMPEATRSITDVKVEKAFLTSASRRRRSSATSSARRAEAWAARRARARRHPQGAQHLDAGAVLAHLPRDAGHPEAERRVLRRHVRGDVAGGRQVRIDRSLLPVEGRAGAHPQPALPSPPAGRGRQEAEVHLLPAASPTCRRASTR